MKMRVLIADDYEKIRRILIDIINLEPDMEVVGEARHGEQAIQLSRTLKPDVVIMDVNMPVMNGVNATKIITREMPGIQVIALSIDEYHAVLMFEAGAVNFLRKGSPPENLIAAIRTACRSHGCDR